MSDYSSPNSNLILTKTNSIVGLKLTEFPQYKSALSKDVDNSLQTMKNITDNNVSFRYKHGF